MTIEYTIKTFPKFDKELKKLSSKCSSLNDDFERLKKVLSKWCKNTSTVRQARISNLLYT